MVSPVCEVKDGSGSYASTTNGVDVTPGDAITIRLADSNVDQWEITCVTTDDLNVAATVNGGLTVNPLNKTASFTAPAAGAALRFRSRVNGGLGPNNTAKPSYTTTFCIYTLTTNGTRTIAADETTEGSPFGWVANVNTSIRSGGGGGGGSVADDIAKHAGGDIDRVRGIRGVAIAGSDGDVPPIGGSLVYNEVGTDKYKFKKPVMPGHLDIEDFGGVPEFVTYGGSGEREGSIASGTTALTVSFGDRLVAGQQIAIGDSRNRSDLGTLWELATISTVVGTAVTLTAPVSHTYTNKRVIVDSLPAYIAAKNAMSGATSSIGGRLLCNGRYWFSNTIDVTKLVTILGNGGRTSSSSTTTVASTQFAFPGGCDGIRFHSGQGLDDAPDGDSGSSAYSQILDLQLICEKWAQDIENETGGDGVPGLLPTTLFLRDFSAAPWVGTASGGTALGHDFVTDGADPVAGDAFRKFTDNGIAGTLGPVPYPGTAVFDGTKRLKGNMFLSDLISRPAYALQFVAEFTPDGSPNADIRLEPVIFGESSNDALFVTMSTSGFRAGHRDSGGIKVTSYVPITALIHGKGCVQVQYDGTHIEIRVNGVACITPATAGSISPTITALVPYIGSRSDGTHGAKLTRLGQVLAWDTAPGWSVVLDGSNGTRTNARIAHGYDLERGHGIRTSVPITIDNVYVERFGENGLAILADGAPGPIFGNADGVRVHNFFPAENGGHGIHAYGGDTQGGPFAGGTPQGNWGWGIYDESLTGNYYTAFIGQGNRGHQEMFHKNCDFTNPTGNATHFKGCYTEASTNLIMGIGECDGLVASGGLDTRSTGFALAEGTATLKPLVYRQTRGTRQIDITLGSDPAQPELIALRWSTYDVPPVTPQDTSSLIYDDVNNYWYLENNGYHRQVTRYPTTQSYWRQPTQWFPNGVFLGDTEFVQLNFMAGTSHSTSKTDGAAATYENGDTVWQSTAAAGGPLGERCLTKGTCGVLNGSATTATTTSGLTTIVVSSDTDLEVGQYIAIVGVSGTKQLLAKTSSLHWTIDSAASASTTGAASFVTPTFETFGGSTAPPSVTPGAFAIDWSKSNVFTKTLGAGANTFTFSNATDGQCINVVVTGAASTLAWPTVKWAAGTPPTQTASGVDVYTFVKAGSTIYGSVVQAMA